MPLNETQIVADIMDDVMKQIGVVHRNTNMNYVYVVVCNNDIIDMSALLYYKVLYVEYILLIILC